MPVFDIAVQRLSGSGTPLWNLDGVRLTDDPAPQSNPVVVADAAGGVIVAWSYSPPPTYSASIFHAQRVAADGAVLWQAGGVPVGAGGGSSSYRVRMAADGAGGAILVWTQDDGIRAQRIRSDGSLVWSPGGVEVVQSLATWDPRIASVGAGGGVVSWQNVHDGRVRLFAQRLDAAGTPAWPVSGILVGSGMIFENYQVMGDGAGGAILAWVQRRDDLSDDTEIFGQRLDRDGATLWTPAGLAICARDGYQVAPELATDGAGGAIVAWVDQGHDHDGQWIMAQRVDAGGAAGWAADGVVVSDRHSFSQRLIADGDGGAFLVWDGFHETPAGLGWPAIFAQRLDSTGQRLWSSAGLEVYTLPTGHYGYVPQLVSDDAGGLILHWTDYRFTGGDTDDIFAQRISDRVPPPTSTPTDLSVTLEASPNPVASHGNLTYVATVTNAGPGAATLVAFNNDIPPGSRIYLRRRPWVRARSRAQ